MDADQTKEKQNIDLIQDSGDSLESDQLLAGKYELLEEIGLGGMGKVFKARDKTNDNLYAVKILKAELGTDPVALKRFEKEAQAASRLNHANLVSVYEHGHAQDGSPYIVMDLVQGQTLGELIEKEGPISESRATKIIRQICEALEEAHNKGVIHRDLKPSNILISANSDDTVKVADFGIARLANESVNYTQTLTETADVVGSPKYMSPEQCTGQALDKRSDIYSLGCVLHEMLTGHPPFSGGNAIQIILKHINDKPPELSSKSEIKNLVKNCLAKSPDHRYPSADALVNDLVAMESGEKVKVIQAKQSSDLNKGASIALISLVIFSLCTIPLWIYLHNREITEKAANKTRPPVASPINWKNDRDVASHMQEKAFFYFKDRDYAQAIPALTYVAATYQKSGDKYQETFAYQCIGQCYLALHQYKQALPWYQKASNGMDQLPTYQKDFMETEVLSGFVEVLRKLDKPLEANKLLGRLKVTPLSNLEKFYRDRDLKEDANRVAEQIKELQQP